MMMINQSGCCLIIRCFGQPAWPSTWPVDLFVLVRAIPVVAWLGLRPLQVLTVCPCVCFRWWRELSGRRPRNRRRRTRPWP